MITTDDDRNHICAVFSFNRSHLANKFTVAKAGCTSKGITIITLIKKKRNAVFMWYSFPI
jgi:hypothetical protein